MEKQHELNVGVRPETEKVDTPLRNNTFAIELLETAFSIGGKSYNVLPIYGKKPILGKWEYLKNSRQSIGELEDYDWKSATGLAVVFGVNNTHSLDIDDVKDESVLTDLVGPSGFLQTTNGLKELEGVSRYSSSVHKAQIPLKIGLTFLRIVWMIDVTIWS